MKNIILAGFMGTGKTSISKKLAQRLKMKYVSTDRMIEEREHRTIADIFAKDGEEYFRSIETSVVRDVSRMKGVVVDTGGGVILRDENIRALSASGTLICLRANVDVIIERTRHYRHRPLLNVEDPKEKIRELLTVRAPQYEKADIHIDTTDRSIQEVVDHIAGLMTNV